MKRFFLAMALPGLLFCFAGIFTSCNKAQEDMKKKVDHEEKCDSPIALKVMRTTLGLTKEESETYLSSLGLQAKYRKVDAYTLNYDDYSNLKEKFSGIISVVVNIPKENFLIKEHQLISIRLNKENKVSEVKCKKIFTGP